MKFEKLFSPIKIGNLTSRNRIIFPPVSTNLASTTGEVTDDFIYHYGRRARGGAGIVTVENACIEYPVTMEGRTQPRLDKEEYIAGLSRLTEEIHKYGALAFIELTHQGLFGVHLPVYAPSDVPLRPDGVHPHVLSIDEIESVAEKFARAALVARKSGFDGVEIEAAHGLLVEQFYSPLTNTRTDEFGGSLENRTRFAKLVIDKIKELCGKDFPVSARLGVIEFINGGIKPEDEGYLIAKKFEEYGYVFLHADVGLGDKEKRLEPMGYPQAWRAEFAKVLKDKGVKVPVVAVGVIREPDVAEKLIENGVSDFVALGRTLIADPDWPIKAMYGQEDSIRKCIGCSECIMSRHVLGTAIRCGINPNVGKSESYEKLIPALQSKKVVVVGAGPAGLEASRILALRGHKVVLFDKEDKIGGALNLVAIPPNKEKIKWLVDFYKSEVERLKIDVRLGVKVDKELIMGESPDAVVLAIGSDPLIPKVPGIDAPNVFLYKDVLTKEKISGKNVVVGGGGLIGCETALYLAKNGNKVTIVEMLDDVAIGMETLSKKFLLRELRENNVEILTKSKIMALSENGVKYERSGNVEEINFDVFVIAFGGKPASFEPLDVPNYRVGDAVKVSKIVEAVRDGYAIGVSL